MNIEKPTLLMKDFQVPRVFHQPTRDEIYRSIIVISNDNHETFERTWKFIYYDKATGIRAEDNVRMDALKYEEAIVDAGGRWSIQHKLKSVKEALVDRVVTEYKKRYLAEVFNMNSEHFDNFHRTLQSLGGEIFLEVNSIDQHCTTATIKLPTYCLNQLSFDVPDQKKNPWIWIEGLPAVEKVETYNDRVVKVTFIDGTFTKAVCSENDHFDLDVGITVCAMKRLLGEKGNQRYNDFIRHAHKVIVENDKKKEAEAREKAEARMKRRKAELKKAAKKLKAKEEQIDIHKQAIIRAHAEMEGLE